MAKPTVTKPAVTRPQNKKSTKSHKEQTAKKAVGRITFDDMGDTADVRAKEKRKRANQLPVAFAYFLTLLICLGIFGGIGYYIVQRFVYNEREVSSLVAEDTTPTAEDRFTTLYVQVTDQGEMENGLLVRVIPDRLAVRIVPVSTGLMAAVEEGDVKSTVGEIFAAEGVVAVRRAVENAYGVDIDKYMTVSDSAFDSVVDYIGGVTYTPTEDMFYYNPQTAEEISCKRGEKIALNHHLLRLFLNYPSFEDGLSTNAKVTADIMESFINDAFMQVDMLTDNLDTIFNIIYNSSDTDMTRNDFVRYKSGIVYILNAGSNPCDSLNPIGTWHDNTFEVSKGFASELAEFFDPTDTQDDN